MKKVKEKALFLRRKGYSYNEINHRLGVSKSTLSCWFSGLTLSDSAKKRLRERRKVGTQKLIDRNKLQTVEAQHRARDIQKKSSGKTRDLSHRELLIVGAVLYWGEGYKRLRVVGGQERTHHQISLTNTDPVLIRGFIIFLTEVLEISFSSIKVTMRLYKGCDEEKCQKYWVQATGLETRNFRKPTYLVSVSSKRKRPYNRLPYGTLQVEVANTEKFHEIMGFIAGIKSAILAKSLG